MQAIQERIRPSADLRNHYNEISKQCRENNEAIIITVNGRGDKENLKQIVEDTTVTVSNLKKFSEKLNKRFLIFRLLF